MLKKIFRGVAAATGSVLLIATPATAQEANLADLLGYREVAPNFFLNAEQIEELRATGCTGGPQGLFDEYRRDMAEDGENWCSPGANKKLGKYFKSGSRGWIIMVTPLGARLEIFMQGKGRNPNLRCVGDIPMTGVYDINMTCFDTANGKMMFDALLGQLFGHGGAMALGSVASNLTAPKAGDTNIRLEGESTAQVAANAAASSGASANSGSTGSHPAAAIAPVNPYVQQGQ